MPQEKKYIVTASMLDAHFQGAVVTDRDLNRQSERLLKQGAIREATAAEVKAYEQAVEAGEPIPFTAGAPLGYPNPNDDPKGEIAAETRDAEFEQLKAAHATELGDAQTRISALEAENKRLTAEVATLKKKQEPAS